MMIHGKKNHPFREHMDEPCVLASSRSCDV
jgi:hypothetical protein